VTFLYHGILLNRSGRTARALQKGINVVMVTPEEETKALEYMRILSVCACRICVCAKYVCVCVSRIYVHSSGMCV